MHNIIQKISYPFIGFAFVALGLLGAFLPLLPTTPFLLVAAYFFGKSSPRLADWLNSHPILGRYIKDWNETRSIPLYAKVLATFMMLSSTYYVVVFKSAENYFSTKNIIVIIIIFLTLVYIWGFTNTTYFKKNE
jgi:uncharacterized membrane protein YbaN (DUF454 family)